MIAIAIVLALTAGDVSPNLPAGLSCQQVRSWVAEYGRARAIAWALRNGYSWQQIREARKCL